jgi:hypothetical protein
MKGTLNSLHRIERTNAGLTARGRRQRKKWRSSKKSADDIERALKLYKSGEYAKAEITSMTGVSAKRRYIADTLRQMVLRDINFGSFLCSK